jgi:biopolymer transport protein ExbD
MKIRRNVQVLKGQVDVAPLVDVVLLLLIFFMLTSSFVFQPGIKVDPPRGSAAGGVSTRYIIAIAAQDPPLIFFNDQATSVDQLRADLESLGRQEASATVVLKADQKVPHGLVVQIMNMAVRAGLSVVIATQPETRPVP